MPALHSVYAVYFCPDIRLEPNNSLNAIVSLGQKLDINYVTGSQNGYLKQNQRMDIINNKMKHGQ